MTARFSFGGNALEISHFSHSEEDARQGNPYNTTFLVTVDSHGFRGISPWEVDIGAFRVFLAQLKEMETLQRSQVSLPDIGYGSEVIFTMDKTGHIELTGTLEGEHRDHSLNFTFDGDQTCLRPFLIALSQFPGIEK